MVIPIGPLKKEDALKNEDGKGSFGFKKPTTKAEFEKLCDAVGLRMAMEIAEIYPNDPPPQSNPENADTDRAKP